MYQRGNYNIILFIYISRSYYIYKYFNTCDRFATRMRNWGHQVILRYILYWNHILSYYLITSLSVTSNILVVVIQKRTFFVGSASEKNMFLGMKHNSAYFPDKERNHRIQKEYDGTADHYYMYHGFPVCYRAQRPTENHVPTRNFEQLHGWSSSEAKLFFLCYLCYFCWLRFTNLSVYVSFIII